MPLFPASPASGCGSSPAGRGPEGAAGACADTAARDPALLGREPGCSRERELQPQESSGLHMVGAGWPRVNGVAGGWWFRMQTLTLSLAPVLLQEDISRLRRKLEKQRKVEVYADADEILQEEIKEYKVRLWGYVVPHQRRNLGVGVGERFSLGTAEIR